MKAPCLYRPWGPPGYIQYTTLCYNDLQPLYGLRGLDQRRMPYVEEKTFEYPVLIAIEMWGASYLSTSHVSFFIANVPFLAISALAATMALFEAVKPKYKRALLFAVGPPLVFYSFHNWDLLAVAPLAGAAWAWSRGKTFRVGALTGLGAAAKLFPAYGVPSLAVAAIAKGRAVRHGVALVGAAVATWTVVNAPFVVLELLKGGSLKGWLGVFAFHARRSPDFGTVWYWWAEWMSIPSHRTAPASWVPTISWMAGGGLLVGYVVGLRRRGRACKTAPAAAVVVWLVGGVGIALFGLSAVIMGGPTSQSYKEFVDVASLVLFLAGFFGLLLHQSRKGRDPWATFGAVVCLFLLVSKVHSPQYALWMLVFFVVVETPWPLIASYFAADAVLLASGFWWFAYSPNLGPSGWRTIFIASVYARALVLAGLLIWYAVSGRDLIDLDEDSAELDLSKRVTAGSPSVFS